MNDIVFFNNFCFNEYSFKETHHRDNSMGVDRHFLGLIKHGHGRIICGGERIEIAEGELLYIPKGCRYHSYWIAEDRVVFDSIGFLYFPSHTPNGYALQKIPYDAALMQAFAPLSARKEVNSESISALFRLLGMLEHRLLWATADRDVTVCEKMLRLMKKDPTQTVAEYARQCEVSESLLYQYVKKVSGKTPNTHRREALLARAAELLVATNYSVEEICDRLGISSAAYFRRMLREVYGKTPSQVRKSGYVM